MLLSPNAISIPYRSCTMSVLKIHAREIFDSRGNPTVEVDLYTKKGIYNFLYCKCERPLAHYKLNNGKTTH